MNKKSCKMYTRALFVILTTIFLAMISQRSYALCNGYYADLSTMSQEVCAETTTHDMRLAFIEVQIDFPEFVAGRIFCEFKNKSPDYWDSDAWWLHGGTTYSCTSDEFFNDFSNTNQNAQNEGPADNSSCNPINLISGNKYKIHTDIDTSDAAQGVSPGIHKPAFTRIYNSFAYKAVDNVIGLNWRHTYQRSLEVIIPLKPAVNIIRATGGASSSPYQSSIYSTAQSACVDGFNEVIANSTNNTSLFVPLRRVTSGTASWNGTECQVSDSSGKYVASMSISSHQDTVSDDAALHTRIRVQRFDGKEIAFIKKLASSRAIWEPQSPNVRAMLEQSSTDVVQPDGSTQFVITYVLTDENDIKETYNGNGRLLSIQYLNGIIETLSYDAGKLSRVENSLGDFLDFAYQADGKLATITDNVGRVWQYQYDTSARLTKVINPDLTEKNYHYEDVNYPNALTGLTDERNLRYSTFEYYADGKARASYLGAPGALPASRIGNVSVNYGATSNAVTDSRGYQSNYHFSTDILQDILTQFDGPECSGGGCASSNYVFDIDPTTPENSTLNLLSKTEYGQTTEFANYDSKHNPQTITEAVGTTEQRQKTYTYDARYQSKVATITEPSVFAGNNKVTTNTYDDFGNLTSVVIAGFKPDGTAVSRTQMFAYNGPFQQLSLIDGPRSDVIDHTLIDYYLDDVVEGDNRARMKKITAPEGVVLYDAIQWTATGKTQSYVTANNLKVEFFYYAGNDRLERLVQTDLDTIESKTTRWTYLATGEIETVTLGYDTPEAISITLGYDNARRLTRITDGLGNYVAYTLDTEGNQQAENSYDPSGVLKRTLSQTFDFYNRLDVSTEANNIADFTSAADGTLDTLTDGNNVVTDYNYDALKRLSQTTQDLGGLDALTANAQTLYDYDVQDNLTQVIAPNGATTTYVYDDLGNMLSELSPDSGTIQYSHDAAGNVNTQTDARGIPVTYSYDALNRVTGVSYPDASENVTYSYDDALVNGTGTLTGIDDSTGTARYSYDGFGNVINDTRTLAGISYTTGYQYDVVNNLKQMTYPDGRVIDTTRDAAGQIMQLASTRDGATQILANSITYAPFGPLTAITTGNGITLDYGYDNDYRVNAISASGVIDKSYGYDLAGNITQINDTLNAGLNQSFDYDAHNRITSDQGSYGTNSLGYDQNGNRTSDSIDTYAYVTHSNRLDSISAEAVLLDAMGNTLAQKDRSYTYNQAGRLTTASTTTTRKVKGQTVTETTQLASYAYNALGQRIQKTLADGSVTVYHYDLDGKLIAESDVEANVHTGYVWLDDQPIAQSQLVTTTTTTTTGKGKDKVTTTTTTTEDVPTYLHTDHLGTPRIGTDASGQIVWRWDGDAFGTLAASEDPDADGNAVTVNLRFAGQYFDNETNLHYNYFRYYDPSTGRYITSDPIGLAGGLNTFGYVDSNPLVYVDSFGLARKNTGSCGRGMSNCNEAEDAARQAMGLTKRNRKAKSTKRGSNKRDKKTVDDIAKRAKIPKDKRREFGDFIEEMKELEGRGGRDNFDRDRLKELADQFKEEFCP